MQLREGQFERATELFYEAAAIPDLWPGALQALADACGATGAVIFPVHPGPARPFPSPGIEEVIHDLVTEGWGASNPRMQRGLQLTRAGMKGLITDRDMFTPEELAGDRHYNEFMVPHGMSATAGMVLTSFGSEFVFPIAFERQAGKGPFFRAEVRMMNKLMVQIRPAAVLALNAGFTAARVLSESLSGAGRHIALLGYSGRIIHLPTGFERDLGDAVTLRGGFLRSWHRETDAKLEAAVSRAVGRAPVGERVAAAIPLPRRNKRRPVMAQVVPISGAGQEVFILARAAVVLTDPEADRPFDAVGEALAVMGLSSAEARLAKRIGAGQALGDIADAEGIAVDTARARLKSVFAKTGTHRQAELAVLVASLRS